MQENNPKDAKNASKEQKQNAEKKKTDLKQQMPFHQLLILSFPLIVLVAVVGAILICIAPFAVVGFSIYQIIKFRNDRHRRNKEFILKQSKIKKNASILPFTP